MAPADEEGLAGEDDEQGGGPCALPKDASCEAFPSPQRASAEQQGQPPHACSSGPGRRQGQQSMHALGEAGRWVERIAGKATCPDEVLDKATVVLELVGSDGRGADLDEQGQGE